MEAVTLDTCKHFSGAWANALRALATILNALANVKLYVWGRVPRIREIHDNRPFGGERGAFCFGLRLSIVYFSLSAASS